jgi:hypothetical protein
VLPIAGPNERKLNPSFRVRSIPAGYLKLEGRLRLGEGEDAMSDFYRSGTVMAMAVIVLAAGVAVLIYG